MLKIVGISDMIVSDNSADILVTYSLGSCVGITLYDPLNRIGGLIHCMLPLSKMDKERARENPCMFVDTGIPALLQAAYQIGANRENLIVRVAGGAHLLDDKGLFRVGERNYTIVRKMLWKNDILIKSQDVGGTRSRTVRLYMNSGRTTIHSNGQEVEL